MDLIYLLKVLYRKIWIIITVPLIAGVAAFLFTRDIEKQYKSTAQLSTGFTTNNRIQITKENFDYWESKSNFENLVEMMKSELIGSVVSYNLLLHDLNGTPFRTKGSDISASEKDAIQKKLNEKISSYELLTSYDAFENKIIALCEEKGYNHSKWLKNKELVIERIKDTDFVKVEFLSENPFLSAFVVNKLCEEYIRYNNALKNTITEESLQFFSNQVEQKKNVLDAKTVELSDYKSSSQVFNYDRESGAKMDQLSEYEIKLQEEENKLNAISISLNSVKSKIANHGNKTTGNNNAKLLQLKSKINELNQIYYDGGSQDEKLAATISNLREQLQTEVEKHDLSADGTESKPKSLNELRTESDGLELEYKIVSSNLTSIRNKVYSLRTNVSRIGSKESTIASLERERDNAFNDYTNAADKYNEAKSKSLISGGSVKVMVKGQPNAEPESSKTLIIIILAMAACGALCLGTIIVIEYFDFRPKTPAKFESFSKIKLIGYINQLSTKKLDPKNLFNQKNDRDRKEAEIVKHFLRKIRFVVDNSGQRVLLVSSTKVGEGKTFLIMSLAHSLSLLNKRILIIDTNFKHNSLTKLMVAKPMLQKAQEIKLLNGRNNSEPINEEEYSGGIISPTIDKNIDIIGSNEGLESPSEIFAGRDFRKMIKVLKDKYDYIFMEGASLNDYSDTKELIQYVDGVITVFSAKSALNPEDRESIKYLKTLNGKFLGAILNNVDKEDIKT